MICCCKKCRFVFESMELLERCPDCGHGPIRAATADEVIQYAANRRLYGPMPAYGAKECFSMSTMDGALRNQSVSVTHC